MSVVSPFRQGPLSTVHTKMFSPTTRPFTAVFGSFALTMEPVPPINDQVPVAGKVIALPLSAASLVGVHSS